MRKMIIKTYVSKPCGSLGAILYEICSGLWLRVDGIVVTVRALGRSVANTTLVACVMGNVLSGRPWELVAMSSRFLVVGGSATVVVDSMATR